jgi:hypothetical protein
MPTGVSDFQGRMCGYFFRKCANAPTNFEGIKPHPERKPFDFAQCASSVSRVPIERMTSREPVTRQTSTTASAVLKSGDHSVFFRDSNIEHRRLKRIESMMCFAFWVKQFRPVHRYISPVKTSFLITPQLHDSRKVRVSRGAPELLATAISYRCAESFHQVFRPAIMRVQLFYPRLVSLDVLHGCRRPSDAVDGW